jgi:hypothetical protein
VGSHYAGTTWQTSGLEAKVLVYVVYDAFGKAYPFFDRPNPIRCT